MEAFSQQLNAYFESWLGPRGEFGVFRYLEFCFGNALLQQLGGGVLPGSFHRLLLDVQRAVCLWLMAANVSGALSKHSSLPPPPLP